MEAEEKLEHLIQTKNWGELTADEKHVVIEILGSEEAYQNLRNIDNSLIQERKSEVLPQGHVLRSLKKEFGARHPRTSILDQFLGYRMPAYAAAIITAIVVVGAFYAGKQSIDQPIAQASFTPRDTVYLSTVPDTVYLTKVVYRNVYRTQQQAVTSIVKNESRSAEHVTVGVNMKEKEELDNLLVSGTE